MSELNKKRKVDSDLPEEREVKKDKKVDIKGEVGERKEVDNRESDTIEKNDKSSNEGEGGIRDDKKETSEVKVESTKDGPKENGGGVQIGGMRFDSYASLTQHTRDILHSACGRLSQDQETFVLDLLTKGHKEYKKKIGEGVEYIKADTHPQFTDTRCFIVVRKDGSEEDFSFYKCVETLFPAKLSKKPIGTGGRGRGSGERGGKGRGRRGGNTQEINSG